MLAIGIPVQAQAYDIPVGEVTYTVCPHYKYRSDGQAGREVLLKYQGGKELKNVKLEVISEIWQAALLNYAEEQGFENINKIEKHTQTDEVFILLEGTAALIAAEKEDNNIGFKVKPLETGIIYNIPPDVWHNIAMDKDARIVIFENANTHLNDCTYHPLNEQQQKELYDILKQL